MTRQTGKCWWREAACRKVGNWDLCSWSRAGARGGRVQDFIVLKQRGRRPGMRCVPATGTLITVFRRNYHSI